MARLLLFTTYLCCLITLSFGQETIVTGKVIEAQTGSPVPFANIYFTGTSVGVTTDFDGFFSISAVTRPDSLTASYIGYITKSKAIQPGQAQIINFQLEEEVMSLQDVVVSGKRKWKKKENPAYPIIRNTIKSKNDNDKRNLSAYEYEAYTKIELDLDNMSEKFRDRKIIKKITQVLDSIDRIAGEDGKPVLPFFISEAISNIYFKSNPSLKHEEVLKTKITGIGIEDGSLTSQVIGGTFQEYNFYQNWLNIFSKQFVSPIADGWSIYYNYELIDSLMLDGHFCYRLNFFPKRAQDLAFFGTIWITKEDYAIKRIDATIDKAANLNHIDKIKIQQDFVKTSEGPWLPEKTRVVADVSQLTKQSPGFLAKFYISVDKIKINHPYPDAFYEIPVITKEQTTASDQYWQTHRHDTLTATEENVYRMIDTLRNIPIIKTATNLGKIAFTGYIPIGKVEIGSYTSFFGLNNLEGLRLGIGARTNIKFSSKFIISGLIAYGNKDKRFKYDGSLEYILNKSPWTSFKVRTKKDIEPIWLVGNSYESTLLVAASRFGNITQPFLKTKNEFLFETQLSKGLSEKIHFTHQRFDPQFDSAYNATTDISQSPISAFQTSEVTFETRYARDEVIFINDNTRLNTGTSKWPVFNLRYILGVRGVLGGDYNYHKLNFDVYKKQKIGTFGVSKIKLEGGHIFNPLPYPLLHSTVGNESRFFTSVAFNLMDYFEFSSSTYASFRYEHSFEGLILNRIPLIKKLKWRLTGSCNAIAGKTSQESIALTSVEGDTRPFETLDNEPYVEVGYGVSNILKVIRVDVFHRLTQLDRKGVNTFTVKLGLSPKL